MSLTRHTLVVPTYNRPGYLGQLVSHCLKSHAEMSILVLDSSREEIVAENTAVLAAMGPRVRHRVFPNTMPVGDKLAVGVGEVTTPHVSLCADDDVVFPSALIEAIDFLEAHPDHVGAHGLYLNFQNHGRDVHITREYAGRSNAAAQPGLRVFRLMQNYESLYYGVFRTADLRRIMDGVAALPSLHYQELFQSVAALLIGKVHRFPKIYAGRRSCEAAEPGRDKWQTYYWFAENPAELLAHYQIYREALWNFRGDLAATDGMDRDTFFKVMDLAHAVYFSRGCPPRYFHSVLRSAWPDEEFEAVENADLFGELRETEAGKSAPAFLIRLWFAFRRRRRALIRRRHVAGLATLDRLVEAEGGTPWSCRLPAGLLWLADVPDFREKYVELCRYLNETPRHAGS